MDDLILARLIDKFAKAEASWFSSTRPDGRAHLAPIWHVWHEGRIYVVTQSTSVRSHNIVHHPAVSLALPDPINVLIVEGTARFTPEQKDTLNPLFKVKYNWEFTTDDPYSVIIEVSPTKIMAWGADGEGRWHFDGNSVRKVSSKGA
jgi:general stress protein 26